MPRSALLDDIGLDTTLMQGGRQSEAILAWRRAISRDREECGE